jgi:hypothetical protein
MGNIRRKAPPLIRFIHFTSLTFSQIDSREHIKNLYAPSV